MLNSSENTPFRFVAVLNVFEKKKINKKGHFPDFVDMIEIS